MPVLRVGDVFVPGGLPTVTYNPRLELSLEDRVRDYLEEGHRVLSLSGPTKSGKTVLLRSIVGRDALWISGGTISGVHDLWSHVADELNAFPDEEHSTTLTESAGRARGGEAGLAAGPLTAKGSAGRNEALTTGQATRSARSRPIAAIARDALATARLPLVIDDFHYIDQQTQLAIVRGLKDLVFEGVRVVLAAVPHRAYDAVRVEKEMTGRVLHLEIPFWETHELVNIATNGFRALNLVDAAGLGDHMASESFSSPHLMQTFCLELCKANNIRVEQVERTEIDAPEWRPFFAAQASNASKSAFDLLARGPRQRKDRKERVLRDGRSVDIYGAVLAAIAHTGPLTVLTYEQLRGALREVISGDAPQRHEVTRVLEEMAKIAKDQIEGEPVVDYDDELATLFISDPFFAYYLRWGVNR